MGEEIYQCDWDHESDDVRRCPTGGDSGAWTCYKHYLGIKAGQDVPPWITLPRQYDDDPDVTLAKRAAKLLADLQDIHNMGMENGFRLTSASVGSAECYPAIQVHERVLDVISDRANWAWYIRVGGEYFPLGAEIWLWDVRFFTIVTKEEAVNYGCSQEVLDEFDASL